MKKKSEKKTVLFRRFYILYGQKFSHLRPLLSITFPPRFQKSKIKKSLDVGVWEVGTKIPLNGVKNTDIIKILLRKAKFAQKQFFCAAILKPLLVKFFKSETISFYYFSLKDSESLKFLDIPEGRCFKNQINPLFYTICPKPFHTY